MQIYGVKPTYYHIVKKERLNASICRSYFYSILYGAEIRVTIETKPYLNYLFKVTGLRVSFANQTVLSRQYCVFFLINLISPTLCQMTVTSGCSSQSTGPITRAHDLIGKQCECAVITIRLNASQRRLSNILLTEYYWRKSYFCLKVSASHQR